MGTDQIAENQKGYKENQPRQKEKESAPIALTEEVVILVVTKSIAAVVVEVEEARAGSLGAERAASWAASLAASLLS